MLEIRQKISSCSLCAADLALGARPVFQFSQHSKILIAGQAPGLKVHESGIPFDDASGDRLRDWMGIDRSTFYDENKIAILPMAFCYPGKGKSGDLPPPKICADTWRESILKHLNQIKLSLIIGQYAQAWHLPKKASLTETVQAWRTYPEDTLPLPHPSPRNNIWLSKHPWFDAELVPELRKRVTRILDE